MLTSHSKATPHPEVVCTSLPNGEVVLLHLATKTYYSLNETGSRIWRQLGQGLTMGQISRDLESGFDVTPETARQSVLDLAGDLLTEKLVLLQE